MMRTSRRLPDTNAAVCVAVDMHVLSTEPHDVEMCRTARLFAATTLFQLLSGVELRARNGCSSPVKSGIALRAPVLLPWDGRGLDSYVSRSLLRSKLCVYTYRLCHR